jgi:hypothetical protein
MKRLIPRASLAVAVVATAFIVTACGSSGSSSSSGSAQQVINETFSGHKKVTSANIALSLNVTPKSTSGTPVSLTVNGPFQSNGSGQLPSFDLSLGVNIRGQSINAGAVSTGTAGYLLFQGQAYTVPANTFASFKQGFLHSQSTPGQHPTSSLSSLGINPRNWLTDLKSDGTSSVGGTTTDHVSAGLDVPTLLTDLATALSKAKTSGLNTTGAPVPTTLTPAQRQQIQSAIKSATVDVYSGQSDHILRRLTMNLGIQSPTNAASSDTLALDLQLTGLNQPQSISAPANPQPISNLRSALGSLSGLLGGLTGGASGGLGGSTGSSGSGATGAGGAGTGLGAGSPSAATAQAYLRCVAGAGSNPAAASKCLSLLHK